MKYRIKSMTVGVAVAAVLACAQAAQAREHHHHHRHHHHHSWHSAHREMKRDSSARRDWARSDFAYRERSDYGRRAHRSRDYLGASVLGGGVGPRPAAWCGWAMRQIVGHDPGPSYNLARNWAHWGRPGPAGVGAIVVWPHHVGKIVGQRNGVWIVQSGNDGHRLRIRPRSIAGAIAIRWG